MSIRIGVRIPPGIYASKRLGGKGPRRTGGLTAILCFLISLGWAIVHISIVWSWITW